MSVIEEIAAERRRQVEAEGWTPDHDDEHNRGEMAFAAACYAIQAGNYHHAALDGLIPRPYQIPPPYWPWGQDWWKPKDDRADLIRAAALIVAEIERLDREDPSARTLEPDHKLARMWRGGDVHIPALRVSTKELIQRCEDYFAMPFICEEDRAPREREAHAVVVKARAVLELLLLELDRLSPNAYSTANSPPNADKK